MDITTVTYIVGILVTGIVAFIGWAIRERYTKVSDAVDEIPTIKTQIKELKDDINKSVSEEHVRLIVHADIKNLKEDLNSELSGIRSDIKFSTEENTKHWQSVLLKLADRDGYDRRVKEENNRNGE